MSCAGSQENTRACQNSIRPIRFQLNDLSRRSCRLEFSWLQSRLGRLPRVPKSQSVRIMPVTPPTNSVVRIHPMQICTHLKHLRKFDEAIVEDNFASQPMCPPLMSCTPNFTIGKEFSSE